VPADLDDLLITLYVQADEFLPERDPSRPGPKAPHLRRRGTLFGRRPGAARLRQRAPLPALLRRRLGHLFPYVPGQSGYNKRVRDLAPQIVWLLRHLARVSPSWCDNLRLVDATPVPCRQSRQTVERSEFAGHAAYGYCAAHSRHFWGFKLYLLAAPDGMPIAFELAPANPHARAPGSGPQASGLT